MKTRTALWAAALVVAIILFLLLAAKPYQPPKARAQHITAVNTVRTVSFILTNTNTLTAPSRIPATR